MKCLRCGHCCIHFDVIIVANPDSGITLNNAVHKPAGEVCPHLRGLEPGQYSCAVHDKPWYKDTPCAAFDQISDSPDDPCRIGEYQLRFYPKERA